MDENDLRRHRWAIAQARGSGPARCRCSALPGGHDAVPVKRPLPGRHRKGGNA